MFRACLSVTRLYWERSEIDGCQRRKKADDVNVCRHISTGLFFQACLVLTSTYALFVISFVVTSTFVYMIVFNLCKSNLYCMQAPYFIWRNIVSYFPPLHHYAYGQSAEWDTLIRKEPTGSDNCYLSHTTIILYSWVRFVAVCKRAIDGYVKPWLNVTVRRKMLGWWETFVSVDRTSCRNCGTSELNCWSCVTA